MISWYISVIRNSLIQFYKEFDLHRITSFVKNSEKVFARLWIIYLQKDVARESGSVLNYVFKW